MRVIVRNAKLASGKSYVQYFSSFLYARPISTTKTREPLHPDTIHHTLYPLTNPAPIALLYIGWTFVHNQYNK